MLPSPRIARPNDQTATSSNRDMSWNPLDQNPFPPQPNQYPTMWDRHASYDGDGKAYYPEPKQNDDIHPQPPPQAYHNTHGEYSSSAPCRMCIQQAEARASNTQWSEALGTPKSDSFHSRFSFDLVMCCLAVLLLSPVVAFAIFTIVAGSRFSAGPRILSGKVFNTSNLSAAVSAFSVVLMPMFANILTVVGRRWLYVRIKKNKSISMGNWEAIASNGHFLTLPWGFKIFYGLFPLALALYWVLSATISAILVPSLIVDHKIVRNGVPIVPIRGGSDTRPYGRGWAMTNCFQDVSQPGAGWDDCPGTLDKATIDNVLKASLFRATIYSNETEVFAGASTRHRRAILSYAPQLMRIPLAIACYRRLSVRSRRLCCRTDGTCSKLEWLRRYGSECQKRQRKTAHSQPDGQLSNLNVYRAGRNQPGVLLFRQDFSLFSRFLFVSSYLTKSTACVDDDSITLL